MYLFFLILFLILLLFFCLNHRRRKNIIKKICSMCPEEKCQLLNELLTPFGYTYLPSQDLFSSQLDAWQRSFGYGSLYDQTAHRLGMVFDCLPVYFDYNNKTWLIEFWKGQYGINTGAETGIYYSDHILDEKEYTSTIFQSVANPDMPVFSFQLFRNGTQLAELSNRHWWLTAFLPGCFSHPEDLSLHIGVTFRNRNMRNAFMDGLLRAGYCQNDIHVSCNTVLFSFTQSTQTKKRFTRWHIRFSQWMNRFWIQVYLQATRPFCLSLDRVLYLYYFLPFCFRRILRMRNYQTGKKKEGVITMSYSSRLTKSFEGALRLPLTESSRYVLISDCHRGVGTANDNFLKNQNLYYAALQHYYRNGYTYIELGDGDELWENHHLQQIMEAHHDVFELLSHFRRQNRLYMLYGNHDMIKKKDSNYYAGIILENKPSLDLYLTHGHQTDIWNSTLWRLSRFLVRFLWKPIERFGVLDPTSAAKNYKRKQRTEKRLHAWAKQENHILITGHTHRSVLLESDLYYCNSGSCIHPHGMTCLEIEHKNIRLVKWSLSTKPDMTLYVAREVLAGPIKLLT